MFDGKRDEDLEKVGVKVCDYIQSMFKQIEPQILGGFWSDIFFMLCNF